MRAIEPFLPLRFILINGESAKVPHFLVRTLCPPHLSPRLLLSSSSSQRSPLQAQGLWWSGTLQCLHQHGFQYQTLSLHLSHTLPHAVQDLILTHHHPPTHTSTALQKNPTLAPHIPPDRAAQGPTLQHPRATHHIFQAQTVCKGVFQGYSQRSCLNHPCYRPKVELGSFQDENYTQQRWMASKRRKGYSPLLGWNKGTGEPQLSVRFYAQNAYPALLVEDRSYIDAFETILLYNKHIAPSPARRLLRSRRPLQGLV